ncbi:DUF6801 domain-containing protein, partial [Streptomyces sp. NE06-03C]|uniref:DUF6801 domain-containing protein n=1 Tax=Streptomyces sp. NE06-03C TaxID=3028694 RepID=UPI0029BE1A40
MTVDARAAARRPIHWAVGGALVVATALVPSAESAAAEQKSKVALRYTCPFPSGPEEADVVVSAVFPTSARTGEEIRPAQVAVEVTLPPTALARFGDLDAATLSAVARLTVRNSVGDKSADASWQDLTAPPAELPPPGEGEGEGDDQGALTLTATGDVPTVAFGSPGRATLAAGALDLALTSLTEAGEPTTPPGLDVACAPAPGQEAELAAIAIRGDQDPTAPAPRPGESGPA